MPGTAGHQKAVKPSDLCRCAEFRRLVLQPSSATHLDGFRFRSAHAQATLRLGTQNRLGQRTQRPSHVTFLRNVTFAYALMPDKAGHRFQRSRSAAKRFSAGGRCPWLQIFRPLTVESNPSQPPHGRCHNGWARACF